MSSDSLHDPEFDEPVKKKPVRTRKGRIVKVLVGISTLGIVVGLFLPAPRSAREAGRRAQCTNNLKQIALALHNYEGKYGALPPAHTVDPNGRPLHSWRTLILPFLEEPALYRTIDLSKPWSDPVNAEAIEKVPRVYQCPTMVERSNKTTYLAIVGPEGCFLPDRLRPYSDIVDGTDSTICVMEADDEHAVPWMAPVDTDGTVLMMLGSSTKTHHPGGVNVAFVDGSIHFLKATMPAVVRRNLLTIAGGESINSDEY